MKKLLPLLLILVSVSLHAWVRDQAPLWNDGTVTMQCLLGAAQTYSDGCTPNMTAVEAANQWNQYIDRVKLAINVSTATSPGKENNTNEIAFASTIYGDPFDSNVLAVTLISYTSKTRDEADILVNSKQTWDAHRGWQQPSTDLRRVLAHEMGHVLGLAHADQYYPRVIALMNAAVSSVDAPVLDDQDGAAAMYGQTPANPGEAPRIDYTYPANSTVNLGQTVEFYVLRPSGSTPFTYQWFKNGTPIEGATQVSITLPNVGLSDAGQYSVVVSNRAGSVQSRSAKLEVIPAIPPTIQHILYNTDAIVARSCALSFYISSGSRPFTIRWFKDGQPAGTTTEPQYYISSCNSTHEGLYSVEVSNAAGTVKADIANLSITSPPLPEPGGVMGEFKEYEGKYYTLAYKPEGDFTFVGWYKDGVLLTNQPKATLTFRKLSTSDSGEYCAVVQNETGKAATSTFKFTVLPTPGATSTTPNTPSPEAAPTPNDAPPTPSTIIPNQIFAANDGSIYILSKTSRKLYNWDPITQQYDSTKHIPLKGMPNEITYSPTLNRIYLLYNDNTITQVQLDKESRLEQPFATPTPTIRKIIPINKLITAIPYSYSNNNYLLLDENGNTYDTPLRKCIDSDFIGSTSTKYIVSCPSSYLNTAFSALRFDAGNTFKDYRISTSPTNIAIPKHITQRNTLITQNGIIIDLDKETIIARTNESISQASSWDGVLYTVHNCVFGPRIKRLNRNTNAVEAAFVGTGHVQSLHISASGKLVLGWWDKGEFFLKAYERDFQGIDIPKTNQSRILGLASRAYVGTGDDVLIPAIVINGTRKKRILIRALGPSLEGSVTEYLKDPQIIVYKVGQTQAVGSNDNWGSATNLSELKKALNGAFPEGSKDSALLLDLDPGAYGIVTSGVGKTTGIAMVDVYDLDADASNGRLVAIATRARTGTGERVLIAGFVIEGKNQKKIHVQGLGPALKNALEGYSLNPQLFLYGASGMLKQNKDWGNDPEIVTAQAKSGATKLETNSKDASLAITQPPGAYSAIIEDEDGKEAITMVEVYEIPE